MAIDNFYADTSPNKAFTIDTFTRDASVQECIFDLIDNSIDAARSKLKEDNNLITDSNGLVSNYRDLKIQVKIDQKSISVEDNCGGMSPSEIRNGILRFGQPSKAEYSIGLYGIGLNRAIYKLGNQTSILTETKTDRSEIKIDMDTYREENDEWLIPASALPVTGETGTQLIISALSNEVEHILADPFFTNNFKAESSKRYSYFILKGLQLEINSDTIPPRQIQIRNDGHLSPLVKTYTATNGVRIKITAGQHIKHRFTIEPDYDKKENDKIVEDYGWSVICNDRVVIKSNKENKTGWETHWHTEFNGFVGVVEFIAKDGRKLPWNTAKSDINFTNLAYQAAIEDMRKFAREWRSFGNQVKKLRRANKPLNSPPARKPTTIPKKNSAKNGGRTATPSTQAPGPVIKSRRSEFRSVLPEDINERLCTDKILNLVHEGKSHDLYDSHYSGLALIRMLFESSSACFLIRHKLYQDMLDVCILDIETSSGKAFTTKQRKDFVPDLSKIIAYLIENYDTWKLGKGKLLKSSIEKFKKYKLLLNDSIHHPLSQIPVSTAIKARDDIMPVLRHFIEE